jgi:DNA repair photolyase
MEKRKTGTKEWSTESNNFLTGCPHACQYCFATHDAVYRYKRATLDEWRKPKLNVNGFNKKARLVKGRIMIPTTHDLLPEFLPETINYLQRWLAVGNEMLIVSKPHFSVIREICDKLPQYKDKMVFRFTIGSMDDAILKFWEPGAPSFDERFASLQYAFNTGYQTSVSSEPYLDGNVIQLANKLLPFVTDSMWIGKLNKKESRIHTENWMQEDFAQLAALEAVQTDEKVKWIYAALNGVKSIKWKDSIKKVMNLPEEEIG